MEIFEYGGEIIFDNLVQIYQDIFEIFGMVYEISGKFLKMFGQFEQDWVYCKGFLWSQYKKVLKFSDIDFIICIFLYDCMLLVVFCV